MSRTRMIVLVVSVLLVVTGIMAQPASAQSVGSETGWVPGQPFLVSITGAGGVPLMVVYAGRVPLASESRVRLLLPSLEDTGLLYAVTTGTTARRSRPIDPTTRDIGKKPQEVVGRIHLVFVQSPVTPDIGTGGGGMLTIGSSADDYTFGVGTSGSNNPGGGQMNATRRGGGPPRHDLLDVADSATRRSFTGEVGRKAAPVAVEATAGDDNGTRRRNIRPIVPTGRFQGTGLGVLGHGDDVLDTSRGRVHTFDSTIVGPISSIDSSSTIPPPGVSVGNGFSRREIGSSRPGGQGTDDPTRDDSGALLRPIRSVPFPIGPHLHHGAILGRGQVILLIGDQGLELGGTTSS